MTEEKPPSTPPSAPDHGAADHEAHELIREYGQPVAIGLVIAVAIFLGITMYRYQQQSAREHASELLINARSFDDLQHIIDQYAKTPSAPLALLGLAAERYREGQYELAQLHYNQFIERHPDHPMRAAAELGLAYCEEAFGFAGQAMARYHQFGQTHPDHYLLPLAVFGQARCLALMNQAEQAVRLYESFLEENPDSPWRAQARTAKLYTEKEMRARERP